VPARRAGFRLLESPRDITVLVSAAGAFVCALRTGAGGCDRQASGDEELIT
jgi:hypothetical protein